MTPYQVGDRVTHIPSGLPGTIAERYPVGFAGFTYRVRHNSYSETRCNGADLEPLVEWPKPRLVHAAAEFDGIA